MGAPARLEAPQARRRGVLALAGRRVVVAPLAPFHDTKGGFGDAEAWAAADAAFRAKWGVSASLEAAR